MASLTLRSALAEEGRAFFRGEAAQFEGGFFGPAELDARGDEQAHGWAGQLLEEFGEVDG